MPKKISLKDLTGKMHHDIDMWRFWQLEEGVLQLPPEVLQTNDGKVPPVIHVDTDAPLHSCVDGSVITEDCGAFTTSLIGILAVFKGAPRPIKWIRRSSGLQLTLTAHRLLNLWPLTVLPICGSRALAHCHKRFEGTMA